MQMNTPPPSYQVTNPVTNPATVNRVSRTNSTDENDDINYFKRNIFVLGKFFRFNPIFDMGGEGVGRHFCPPTPSRRPSTVFYIYRYFYFYRNT